MDYKQKAQLIIEFTEQELGNEQFDDFFDYNDLGVPVAIALVNNLITLTKDGEVLIDETYQELCNLFDADPNEDYQDIDDLIG